MSLCIINLQSNLLKKKKSYQVLKVKTKKEKTPSTLRADFGLLLALWPVLVQTPGLRLPASLSTVTSVWPSFLGCPCLHVSLRHTHPAQRGSLPRLVHRQIPRQSAVSERRNSKPLGAWGRMDTCTCMAESLCCSPETVTSLLTDYIPIQNKFKKEKKKTLDEDWYICLMF